MLNAEAIRGLDMPPGTQAYDEKDAILYALGVGALAGPFAEAELDFAYERRLAILPTFGLVLCRDAVGILRPEFGINAGMVLHAGQSLDIHAPLPPLGVVTGKTEVIELTDKGPGVGALLRLRKRLSDTRTGVHYQDQIQTLLLRGDGGFAGIIPMPTAREPEPQPPQDAQIVDLPIGLRQSAIYRLTGDRNPLHIDPAAAARAGFPRPILMGMSTLGMAARALIHTLCAGDAARLAHLSARFSRPVFQPDTLRVFIWEDGADHAFLGKTLSRMETVLAQGIARVRGGSEDSR